MLNDLLPDFNTMMLITSDPDPQLCVNQCCRSDSRSGSESCFFRQWPSRSQLKIILIYNFCLFFLSYYIKTYRSHKTVRIKVYYFSLIKEESGSESVHRTTGSGSGTRRPKSIRILRIRIRNTGVNWNYTSTVHSTWPAANLNQQKWHKKY